ncbi:MAG TPA: Clp protease N-terminal domain-containing protein [Actinocatenispora sp.]
MTTPQVSLGTLIDRVSGSSTDPLERLDSAVRTASDLSTLGDQLVSHFVDAARATGASWAQIGQYLGGVSKQAAQQRFSPDLAKFDFSRFTERARKAVVGAQAVAQEHQHSYIGTEHILLGLCADADSLAGKALARQGGSLDAVRQATEARLGDPSPVQAKPRFTPKGRAALAQALSAALNLGHNYIGTEHLLLGLAMGGGTNDQPSLAMEIFAELGIGYQALHDDVVAQIAGLTGK